MSAPPPPQPLWQAVVDGQHARVELWMHPEGWECRVFSQGRLVRHAVHADVRDAHREASLWLSLLAAEGAGGEPTDEPKR